jgi:hypothetical protein
VDDFWGYSDEVGYVRFELKSDRMLIRHQGCGFEAELPYVEFRGLDVVQCPNCNVVLASYREMIDGFDAALGESSAIKHRHRRMQVRRDILRTRERILKG